MVGWCSAHRHGLSGPSARRPLKMKVRVSTSCSSQSFSMNLISRYVFPLIPLSSSVFKGRILLVTMFSYLRPSLLSIDSRRDDKEEELAKLGRTDDAHYLSYLTNLRVSLRVGGDRCRPLKPYDLHALLEAHLELGLSTDQDDFSRSSVIQVLKQKTITHCGRSLLLYRVKISAGALSLRGLADASAFVIPAAITAWIPASTINYALPGLYSRSNRSTSSAKSQTSRQSQQRKSIRKAPPVASGSSRTLEMLSDSTLSESTLSEPEVIDLTWLD
ncbi:hypothetical protein R3P38DRAFT_3296769 [Favolaschia claudopus]|uniref:Uncharacterized protein n=1 Tax=Favolaschia claudopus TaxID=2862362 RepID=A0AAV9Z8C4_9AGAR